MARINYNYKCTQCGYEEEELREIEERNNSKECSKCKGEMKLKIGSPPFKFIRK